ncbi:hypothetical protein HanXRQr2_Chr04g0155651 [Helianthus annuus]|uniref:Uncharacterized protein n=1 Tax=Helianthus annuus TaxID=4232 RepID=A0A9K3J6G6_HELAN|nr:hypothetical protein HanXRQr2_Chr04g0155651 [Helianthus annuus]
MHRSCRVNLGLIRSDRLEMFFFFFFTVWFFLWTYEFLVHVRLGHINNEIFVFIAVQLKAKIENKKVMCHLTTI